MATRLFRHSLAMLLVVLGLPAWAVSPGDAFPMNGTSLLNESFSATTLVSPFYKYNPVQEAPPAAALGWTFTGSAGVTAVSATNGFTAGNTGLNTGQLAFLQNSGRISQTVQLVPGTYKVVFRSARRMNYQYGTQVVQVRVGGTARGNFTPTANFATYETAPFTIGSTGPVLVELAGVGTGTDFTAFVDNVAIASTTAFGFLWSNNVTIDQVAGPSPVLVTPDLDILNKLGVKGFQCPAPGAPSQPTAMLAPNGGFSSYRAVFRATDLMCSADPRLLGNINPNQTVERYVWAEGKSAQLTFDLTAKYRGRGYGQPVFDIYHRDYNINVHGTSKHTFYINPGLFDGVPQAPPSNPNYPFLYFDSYCTNGCTGKPLIGPWFGVANPYMSFGSSARCPLGNAISDTTCALSVAKMVVTRQHIETIVTAIKAVSDCGNPSGPHYYCGTVNADDWRILTYGFNFELPARQVPGGPEYDLRLNSLIDVSLSNVSFALVDLAPPSVTMRINGQANGSAAMRDRGSFTLSYTSANATGCSLTAYQNGQFWYTENRGLAYDFGTVSGWGGPADFRWTVTCTNAAGQQASSTVSLVISVDNGSFEVPALAAGSYAYGPTIGNSGWTFMAASGLGGSGIATNGSLFTVRNEPYVAPDGNQVAFIQGGRSMSRTINVQAAGTFKVRYLAAKRGGQPSALTVTTKVNGSTLGSSTPNRVYYETVTTSGAIALSAGPHTLEFSTTNPGGDNTVFIDMVQIIRQ